MASKRDPASSQSEQGSSGKGEFKRGWPIIVSALLGVGLGLSPLPFYTAGIFAPHLTAAFGWTIGEIMGGITITSLVVLVAGPLVGVLATRFGARRVALTSTVLFAFTFMAFALSNGSLPLFYLMWGMVALLGAGTLPMTWTVGVNQRFDKHKGLALGLSLMGTGLFGFVSKPLVAWMIDAFGWRGAYVGLGLLPLLIAAPFAYFVFFEVGEKEARAARRNAGDGKPSAAEAVAAIPAAAPRLEGLNLAQTVRQWRFWLIAIALLLISFALAGPVPNMENILRAAGFGRDEIIQLTSLIGLSALTGRFVGGWLLDRFWAPGVALIILLSPSASCWLLAQPDLTPQLAFLSICLIGFALGVEYDLMAFLIARYFGTRSYASIYGLLYVFFSLGAGVGPLVFGWSFDQRGSYATILTYSFFALFVSAISLLLLGRYRYAAGGAASPAVSPGVGEKVVPTT